MLTNPEIDPEMLRNLKTETISGKIKNIAGRNCPLPAMFIFVIVSLIVDLTVTKVTS